MFSHKTLLTTAIGVFSLLAVNAVIACEGKTVIFEDKFEDDTGGWESNKAVTFENSAMNIRVRKGAEALQNVAFTVRDADICVEANFPTTVTDNTKSPSSTLTSTLGIEFWATDNVNTYLFRIGNDGTATISRLSNNKWTNINTQEMNAVKKTPGASNLLRVTVKGNLVSMYVNGVKYRDQRAQASTVETRFGVYVDTVADSGNEQMFTFKNFKVTSAD